MFFFLTCDGFREIETKHVGKIKTPNDSITCVSKRNFYSHEGNQKSCIFFVFAFYDTVNETVNGNIVTRLRLHATRQVCGDISFLVTLFHHLFTETVSRCSHSVSHNFRKVVTQSDEHF